MGANLGHILHKTGRHPCHGLCPTFAIFWLTWDTQVNVQTKDVNLGHILLKQVVITCHGLCPTFAIFWLTWDTQVNVQTKDVNLGHTLKQVGILVAGCAPRSPSFG